MKLKKIMTTASLVMTSITPVNAQLYMCKLCSAGTYSDGTKTSCKKCPAGTYSSAGASSCSTCSAGTYSSSAGAGSCTTCPTGTYSSAGASSCINCLTTGVSACSSSTGKATSCKSGYILKNGICNEWLLYTYNNSKNCML